MKETELRSRAICSCCKKKIGSSGLPSFWTVTVNRYGIDMGAIRRSTGLAMMLGSAQLAQIMGKDEDMAEKMMETEELTLCEFCSMPVMELLEKCK